ncbi:MAG: hypothetical protein MJ092_00165 [Lachnospiraceae bacterium]|nr:hypothetical protein [Lachnospiraceae bacterium]
MLTTKNKNSIVKSILRILLAVLLLTATLPIITYAADNNPEGHSLDAFPSIAVSLDTMNENLGTINALNTGGTINNNRGNISSSYGTVMENFGSIDKLLAGHVGTNYGTINLINNTGSLGVNDKDGTVLVLGMGNEIDRNYGTIQENAGNVYENFGTVGINLGTVIMHDGQIENNRQNGTVTFEEKIVGSETVLPKGSINNNEGTVHATSGTITIKENTGNIEINNATVTVEKNSGNITVGDNGTLICGENRSDGVITKSSQSAVITCTTNNGILNDLTVVLYKIVFVGDDGQAEVLASDDEKDDGYYTEAGSDVVFTLPPEYACKDAWDKYIGDLHIWVLNATPEEGDTEFTIFCHKCSSDEYMTTVEKHWQKCEECGRMFNEDPHTNVVIDQSVEPTETSTGLTQGSHCGDCHMVLTAQKILPKILPQHTDVSSTSTENKNVATPQTGDSNNMLGWLLLLGCSAAALTVLFLYRIIARKHSS